MQTLPQSPIVAVVEDEDDLRENIIDLLQGWSYKAWGANSAETFFRQLAVHQADVVLLDLGLPGEDGISVLKHLQQTESYLFIIVSARGAAEDKNAALAAGAKAYFVKPVNFEKLLSCIAELWRQHIVNQQCSVLWRLDTVSRALFAPNGDSISLTTNEYRLVAGLMAFPGQSFSKNEIISLVWEQEQSWRNYHSVEVLLSRLRNKALKQINQPLPIQSVQSVGLVFTGAAIFI